MLESLVVEVLPSAAGLLEAMGLQCETGIAHGEPA